MQIPAIRSKMGIWVYYVSALTFEQISDHVKRIDDELHDSKLLREMLQRSITANFKNISTYILHQEERFFNSLVLAVYDGDPQWNEVRLEYDDNTEFFDLGFLKLTGKEKIFPVDGQHRVEGIKEALEKNPLLKNEKVPVIFIGHKKDDDGMQRVRRMFSTLNRYAKPVSLRDIIVLDEDDIIAITSRELIDSMILFSRGRLLDSKTKAIPKTNKTAFTTIITFYECNRELLGLFLRDKTVKNNDEKLSNKNQKISQFIRFRPCDEDLIEHKDLCDDFWCSLSQISEEIHDYFVSETPSSEPFRNKNGGNILFRPAALLPFVAVVVDIKGKTKRSFADILNQFPKEIFQLDNIIWKNVLWNDFKKTMIINNNKLVSLIYYYYFDKKMLNQSEIDAIKSELTSLRQLSDGYSVEQLLNDALAGNDDE